MIGWPACGWSGLLEEVLAQVRHVRVERTYKSWDMGAGRIERLFMRERRTERVCMRERITEGSFMHERRTERVCMRAIDGLLEEVLAQVRQVKVEGTYKSRVTRHGRT